MRPEPLLRVSDGSGCTGLISAHDEHDPVEREQPADDPADVEAVRGTRGGRLVDIGGAGRLGHDGRAERRRSGRSVMGAPYSDEDDVHDDDEDERADAEQPG
jgi:hypothetical protein